MKKSDVNKLARKIDKTNKAIWDAINLVEELLNNESFLTVKHIGEDNEKLVKELAEAYMNIKNVETGMSEPESYSSYFQDFQYFASKFQDYLDEIEE